MINQDALQFFELVHLADLIQQMIDVYYSEDIKPWIDENDFLSEIAVEKKAFERLLVIIYLLLFINFLSNLNFYLG